MKNRSIKLGTKVSFNKRYEKVPSNGWNLVEDKKFIKGIIVGRRTIGVKGRIEFGHMDFNYDPPKYIEGDIGEHRCSQYQVTKWESVYIVAVNMKTIRYVSKNDLWQTTDFSGRPVE